MYLKFISKFLDEVFLPRCMLCDGLSDRLLISIMLFSSGGTKSVLHYDDLENIICLFDGSKELVMIDKVFIYIQDGSKVVLYCIKIGI